MRKLWPANFLDHEQGSPEWLKARLFHVTASRVAEVTGKIKNGSYSKDRLNYMEELQAEMATGYSAETYVTAEMQFGIDNEPLARSAYEAKNEVFVDRVGFVLHPTITHCGASPDGMVGEDGGVEIKVPKTVTHLRYRRLKVVPEEYKPQMYLNMSCTGRKWWDFFSFDPRCKGDMRIFQVRLYRDEKEIEKQDAEILKFLEELALMASETTEPMPLETQLERSIEASKAFRSMEKSPFKDAAEAEAFYEEIVP